MYNMKLFRNVDLCMCVYVCMMWGSVIDLFIFT